MKTYINLFLLPAMLLGQACNDGKSNENSKAATATTTASNEDQPGDGGVTGEWLRIESGYDKNNNGVLDAEEKMSTKSLLDGFDYFKFMSNGKCVYDKDVKFDGEYVVKAYKKADQQAIFIYPSGLPAVLTDKQRDENALIYKIRSVKPDQLILSPAHQGTTLVVYKKL
jgi:hypothetical protein